MASPKPSKPEPVAFSNPVALAAEVAKALRERRIVRLDASKATDEDVRSFLDAYALLKRDDPTLPDVYINPR